MLCHLYADVVEEEGAGAKAGAKKKGGSMQTISATHRVSSCSSSVHVNGREERERMVDLCFFRNN